MRRHWKVAVALFAAIASERAAHAADMDPAPERLYLEPPGIPSDATCQSVASNPQGFIDAHPGLVPNSFACLPNNIAWANLMSELGYAIAPSAFHPARTTGFGGFSISIEASFAHVNANARDSTGTQYWHAGTEGPVDASTHQFSVVNANPDSILQVYALDVRKGLPFGLEVAGSLGYVANTSLWVAGGDVRWAVLEGYRTGLFGYVPDISVGGGIRTLEGASSFSLTTVGIDVQLSKPFTLADSAVLSPFIGVQRLIIFANSSAVDLTPNVDPVQQCGYLGANVPSNPQGHAPYDGTPICSNTLKTSPTTAIQNDGDYNNDVTFQSIQVHRWRAMAGLTYKYEILYLGGQFAADVEAPSAENANLGISGARQWTVSLEAGAVF